MIFLVNFLKEGEFIFKYKDIEKIYNISDITDNYIVLNNNNNIKKVYIYKISPITLINKREEIIETIVYKYKEILSIVDFDFQILIKNVPFNVDSYIQKVNKKINNNIIRNSCMFKKYIENLKLSLEKEKIYDMEYYIMVIDSGNINFIENIDNMLKKFKLLGCNVIRVDNKKEICEILNYFINREKEEVKNEFL